MTSFENIKINKNVEDVYKKIIYRFKKNQNEKSNEINIIDFYVIQLFQEQFNIFKNLKRNNDFYN